MKEYKMYSVLLTRDCTESAEIRVIAEDPDKAIDMALYTAANDIHVDWVPDDWSSKPYLADEECVVDLEEYEEIPD